MEKNDVEKIFAILFQEFPDESKDIDTELIYGNHYQLLVAIILSAQMTDAGVNRVIKRLFPILKSPLDAVGLGVDKINEYIKTINYHNTKSKHIVEMSQQLIDRFNMNVPDDFNDLISLSGVGRKTANLFLSTAYQKPRIAVDTHVFRVANRIGLANAKNVLATEKQLYVNVPSKLYRQINNLLIPFGRKYCKAIRPRCIKCPLHKFCKYVKKQSVTDKNIEVQHQ